MWLRGLRRSFQLKEMGALIETQQLLLISHRTAVTVIGLLCWGGLNLGAIRTQFGACWLILCQMERGQSWPADRLLLAPRSGRRGCAAHLHQASGRQISGNSWRT